MDFFLVYQLEKHQKNVKFIYYTITEKPQLYIQNR